MLNPTSVERSPYRVMLTDVVVHFATSSERRQILRGWLGYRAALHGMGLTDGFQWLDGSFLEQVETPESRPPQDMDVVTFLNPPASFAPTQPQIAALDNRAAMNTDQRNFLLAERETVKRMLAKTPVTALLTRMSDEARLRNIEAELAALPADGRSPARARLTFDGLPVIGSHGIFADFGMKAVNSFTDVVATVAASLSAPLAAMGPIPNRDQNQLLITNTAVGSFGFELEEYRAQELPDDEGAVAVALDRTQSLLQATLVQDDELADIASETDPRALDKVRGNILPKVSDVKMINDRLHQRVRVEVMRTQVGNGRPRFLLTQILQRAEDAVSASS